MWYFMAHFIQQKNRVNVQLNVFFVTFVERGECTRNKYHSAAVYQIKITVNIFIKDLVKVVHLTEAEIIFGLC